MSFGVLLEQILIIFLMIGVGFIAQKTKIVTTETSKVLSDILVKIALPFTLLAATNLESGKDSVGKMFVAFGLLIACYAVSAVICEWISRRKKMAQGKKAVFIVLSVFPNSAFIGIPILSALLGAEGIIYGAAGIMAYNLLFFTYGMMLFKKGEKIDLKTFITPANITTLVMIVMLLFQWRFPAPLESFCSAMGGITTPLALLIIGVMIGSSNLVEVVKNRFLYSITALRCFVFPLVFAGLLSMTPLDQTLCMAAVILAACASGTLGAVLAKQMDMEPELASQAVVQTTLFLVFSMPLVIAVAQAIL